LLSQYIARAHPLSTFIGIISGINPQNYAI
jgi:hypothetical protein